MTRRWELGAVVAVAMVLWASPQSEALPSGQPGIDDLVISSVEGFETNVLGIDGEVDLEAFAVLSGIDEDQLDRDGDQSLGLLRSFVSIDGTRTGFIFAIVKDGNPGREGFAWGSARAMEEADYRPLDTPFTSEAVVTYEGSLPGEGEPVELAVASYGSTDAGFIVVATDQGAAQTLQELLRPQLAFAPAVEPEESEEDSATYRLGYRLGNWVLLGGVAFGLWFLWQRRSRSASQTAGPSAATRERLKTTMAQWEPYRRVQASAESSTESILERHDAQNKRQPVPLAIQERMDRDVIDRALAADSEWLRLALTEGWRLGRAALRLEDDAYPYEHSNVALPSDRAGLLDEAVSRLVSSSLPRSITGHLRDSVASTAQSLSRHQPISETRLARSDIEPVVWRGVAIAFAEFEVLHAWAPPEPEPAAVLRQRRVLKAPNRGELPSG